MLLGLPNGKQRSRNLWKLVALAAEKDEMSCGEFAATLKLMREFNVQKTDAPLDTRDSVKLITIHSSKGLEFPAVVLPVLDVNASARNDRLVFHREYGLAINTSRSDGDEKPAWYDVACSINNEMELAEKQRLFYVAATRARDYLGIFLDSDARNVPSFRLWLKERLGLNQQDDNGGAQQTVCAVKYVEDQNSDASAIDSETSTVPLFDETSVHGGSIVGHEIEGVSTDVVDSGVDLHLLSPDAISGIHDQKAGSSDRGGEFVRSPDAISGIHDPMVGSSDRRGEIASARGTWTTLGHCLKCER